MSKLLSLIFVLSHEQALVKHIHQIKVGAFKLDPLAPQLFADNFFLFLDVLGPIGDLLKDNLHHVHLADGEASHFRQGLLLHVLVARGFELLKLLIDDIE